MLTNVKVIIIAILALSVCYDEIQNVTRYQTAMLTNVKVIIIAILALSVCYDEIQNVTRYQTAMLTNVKVIIIAILALSVCYDEIQNVTRYQTAVLTDVKVIITAILAIVCFYTQFVSNFRQSFAADDFRRRHFQMHFFLALSGLKSQHTTNYNACKAFITNGVARTLKKVTHIKRETTGSSNDSLQLRPFLEWDIS